MTMGLACDRDGYDLRMPECPKCGSRGCPELHRYNGKCEADKPFGLERSGLTQQGIEAMTCPYAELANKIEVHQKFDTPGVGYVLTQLDVQTIIEALRYTSDWKAAIDAANGDTQQERNIPGE